MFPNKTFVVIFLTALTSCVCAAPTLQKPQPDPVKEVAAGWSETFRRQETSSVHNITTREDDNPSNLQRFFIAWGYTRGIAFKQGDKLNWPWRGGTPGLWNRVLNLYSDSSATFFSMENSLLTMLFISHA